jgi:hypothetical protein
MKVLLKKSTEDMNWGGDDYDIISLNPISKAMTDCYLPQWSPSPLKAMLLKRLGTVKQMYLSLKVRYADNIVTFISLRCNLLDDVERLYGQEMDMEAVYQCLAQYFQNIGYRNIECTGDEEIVCFVKRLEQDVPLAKTYFEFIENKDL